MILMSLEQVGACRTGGWRCLWVCMEEGCMVSILLLEEEYIYRKDALDLKPKVALSQILSPQFAHEPICHY